MEQALTQRPTAMAGREAFQKAFEDLEGPMGELSTRINEANRRRQAEAASLGQQALLQVGLAGGLTSLAVLAFSMMLGRSISRPLATLAEGMEEVSQGDGDLTRRIDLRQQDELGRTAGAFNRFAEDLCGLVGALKDSSHRLMELSERLSDGSRGLKERTERQAATLEESAAALEQFGSSVGQNAELTQEARRTFEGAFQRTQHGTESVGRVVQRMEALDQDSARVQEIVAVVDELAFQTNLLALNAAVEAARAGEHGRGFAVVAAEVRQLAGRSAASAGEIRTLLRASAGLAREGSGMAREAGEAMREIQGDMAKVRSLVEQIAEASREQARAIAEIAHGMSDMERSTQQNALLVDEAAGLAGAVAEEATDLAGQVGRYRA